MLIEWNKLIYYKVTVKILKFTKCLLLEKW